jgi:sugar phosphate isomerase/epimerase
MTRIMTSSWSLHRTLGQSMYQWPDLAGKPVLEGDGRGEIALLELPAQLALRGIGMLEICHFHFPRLDDGYINELRQALSENGIELFSILIDAGDIAHPDPGQRQREIGWIHAWMQIAARCGARCVRVIAGDAEPGAAGDWRDQEAVQISAEGLRHLAGVGRQLGLRVITENFRALGGRAGALNAILDLCEGAVGLCVDFGNFKGPDKYDELAALMPRATSVHAKADFRKELQMDRTDFDRCLQLARDAAFAGPYSLIFSSPGDEWEGVAKTQEVVEAWL